MCPFRTDIQAFVDIRTAHSADGGAWKKRSSGGWLRRSWQRELSLLRGTVGLIRATPQQICGAHAFGQWSIALFEDSNGGGKAVKVEMEDSWGLNLAEVQADGQGYPTEPALGGGTVGIKTCMPYGQMRANGGESVSGDQRQPVQRMGNCADGKLCPSCDERTQGTGNTRAPFGCSGANTLGQWSIALCEDSSGGGRSAPVDVDTIRVLQLNIWKSFNGIEGGAEALADEIAFHRPDIVSLNEIVTSVANPVHDNILAALERRGLKYYLSRVQECDVLSVAPLTEISRCYPDREEGRGAVMVAHTVIRGHRLAVYSAHLDYLDDAYYNIRGIDGSTWKPCPVPSSVGEVLERNDRSWRDEAIGCFLNAARRDMEQGWKVIMCGDFNEPSHLDWTQRTSQMYDHHGFVVPWTCTTMLERGGFADAYRAVYADETVYPGFTFPAWCESVDVKQLAWAPDSDERDRIDYVFYHAGSGMKAVGAALVGPEEMVCRSAKAPHGSSDRVHRPQGLWPSDHRGVLVEIEINAAGSVGAVNAGRR